MECKSLSNKELQIIRWFDNYISNKMPIEPQPIEPQLEPPKPQPIEPAETELLRCFKKEFATMMKSVNGKTGKVGMVKYGVVRTHFSIHQI